MTQAADFTPSRVHIIQRIDKSVRHPYGVRPVSYAPINHPSIVLLGGEGTIKSRYANYYASMIQDILHNDGIHDINIYSVYYDFGNRIPKLDRTDIFRRAGYKIEQLHRNGDNKTLAEMYKHEPIPHIAIKLFNVFIRPRIMGSDDRPRHMDQIMSYMGRIFFWTHSYGGTIMNYLGEYMRDEMRRIGFSAHDIDAVCQQILVIGHAPTVPMFRQPFRTLNFVSCGDTIIENVNHMTDYLNKNADDITPMYMDESCGNVITTGFFYSDYCNREHNPAPLRKNSAEYRELCDDGRVVFDAERNAITNAARYISQTADGIPSPRELVSGPTVNFDKMAHTGKTMYEIMLKDIRSQKHNKR